MNAVECKQCCASTFYDVNGHNWSSLEEAIAAWNTRADTLNMALEEK